MAKSPKPAMSGRRFGNRGGRPQPSRGGTRRAKLAGSPRDSYRRVYAVVSRIPKGRVATYGQVAALAGLPRQARFVGYALHALPAASDVPWHRVLNAAGRISPRADALGHDELQGHLLRREGVRFVAGAIPLAKYRWQPRR